MNWAYIAGFFDGEGHLRVKRGGRVWQLTQVHRGSLEQIAAFLGRHGIPSHIYDIGTGKSRKHWQPISTLFVMNTPDVVKILQAIRPWVIVKKQEIEDVLRFLTLFPSAHYGTRTHCTHGHLLSGDNIRYSPRGQRVCKACHKRRNTEYRQQRRSA